MLIWLVLIPLIASALIGLCKAPARPTALLSATLTLALGIWALVSFDDCASCWSRFQGLDLQLTLAPAMAKVMSSPLHPSWSPSPRFWAPILRKGGEASCTTPPC